jgi:predicted PolB exonuclease-like 3'-5' exonuclease
MLEQYRPEDFLFIDIETVPGFPAFDQLSEAMQELWDKKSSYFRKDDQTPADAYERAGIYSEFGRIICISVGIILNRNGQRFFRLKSFFGHDEKVVLVEFAKMLNAFGADNSKNLCGHNIKEFDIPYICRRMLINGIKIPAILDVAGKKPWEVKFVDTLELWKFGDYKHYTSLNLLTAIFNIPSPKDDIDGSQVAKVYYEEGNLERIAVYCEKDVLATAQLFLRFRGDELIDNQNIERVL